MEFILDFQARVLENLNLCLSRLNINLDSCNCGGVAVSGGADSISLLVALKKILNIQVKAVTVNHNIRASEESSADADYVESVCRSLDVKCVRYDVAPGEILSLAKKLKTSIEDAARKIRYEKFSDFIENEGISFLCLAHNKNDQIETLAMRFLQGSANFCGIPLTREKFIRPLLNISRSEIEKYLQLQKIAFRTDRTNFDNQIFRNRIRNKLVPFLDNEFSGWQNAVFSLAEKSRAENEALSFFAEQELLKINCKFENEKVSFDAEKFSSLPLAIKIRIIFKGIDFVKASERIPYSFASSLASGCFENAGCSECGGLEFSFCNGRFLIQKKRKVATESGFFVIIEKKGSYQAGEISFEVFSHDDGIFLRTDSSEICLKNLKFPFVFRSRQPDDFVKNADGSFRQVSKILDDWKTGNLRDSIPLIQNICPEKNNSAQEICCVWGSLFGFKDWIVK
ncbi:MULTISPECIES: tRNA lysidine(34) synthetase TilS [unclassified Treponema]|uniref:tRNA lysidine(34) synthetase TilS n=1 Tax=unclassified Treponema TaxID=2638727 RepID=UPI0025D8478C|nr:MULTISPECIES: tRNA lysidine(34) synthetase TilS [unclassified Treponema]